MRFKQPYHVKIPKTKRAYSHDALTNAYIECVENNMPARKAAKLFNVPRSTLMDRLSGKIHIDTVTTKQPLFSQLEEAKLAHHLKTMASYGYGYTRQECLNLASDMAVQLGKRTKEQPLTFKWIRGFLKRWPDLRVLKPRGLEYTRAKMASETTVSRYFDNLKQCLNEHGLTDKPHLVFNLDEKGLTTEHKPPCVIGSAIHCPPGVTSGRGKTVTILGCISASGMAVPPFFVFPGKRMNPDLLKGKSPGADGTVSETGWSNQAVFRQYLMEHFIKFIPGHKEKVLLILDGHKSHVSVDVCDWAKEHGIIFFFLPPHTSHILQPLDVSCYGPFERMFNNECHKMMRQTEAVLTRYNVCEIACRVYSKALGPDNAQSAFRRTGIYPLDKAAIPAQYLLPAEVYGNGGQAAEDDADSQASDATVQGGIIVGTSAVHETVFQSLSAKVDKLKSIKSEKKIKPRKTVSKTVAGKQMSDDVLDKLREHQNKNKKIIKNKPNLKINPKKLLKKVKIISQDPKPGPSRVNMSPEISSDSDTCDTQTECCVCNKVQPEEISKCESLVFVKWAQCDWMKHGFPCLHWVHLTYCTPVRVIRKNDKFFCPHCNEE